MRSNSTGSVTYLIRQRDHFIGLEITSNTSLYPNGIANLLIPCSNRSEFVHLHSENHEYHCPKNCHPIVFKQQSVQNVWLETLQGQEVQVNSTHQQEPRVSRRIRLFPYIGSSTDDLGAILSHYSSPGRIDCMQLDNSWISILSTMSELVICGIADLEGF